MPDTQASTYVASYTHDDRAWIVQFHELGIATFGRTLAAAKRYARSALAVYLEVTDLHAAGVQVIDDVQLPTAVSGEIRRLSERRSEAESLRAEVAESTRQVATDLRRLGYSTRDVGEILGISGARVAQIERDSGRR